MYEIVAQTAQGEEVVDTAESRSEAGYLVTEYGMAFGTIPVWYRRAAARPDEGGEASE